MAEPPETEILNAVELHFSQCGGPTCDGEQCDSLCGRSASDGNVSYE